MQKIPTFRQKHIKDGKLFSPAMESTTKSNVLKDSGLLYLATLIITQSNTYALCMKAKYL